MHAWENRNERLHQKISRVAFGLLSLTGLTRLYVYIYILYILCSGKSDGQVTTYSILLLIVSRGNIVNRTKYC